MVFLIFSTLEISCAVIFGPGLGLANFVISASAFDLRSSFLAFSFAAFRSDHDDASDKSA
jgi:hypothetical protein